MLPQVYVLLKLLIAFRFISTAIFLYINIFLRTRSLYSLESPWTCFYNSLPNFIQDLQFRLYKEHQFSYMQVYVFYKAFLQKAVIFPRDI